MVQKYKYLGIITSNRNVLYFLTNIESLEKLVRYSKALVSEMNRVRMAIERCSESLRQVFSDKEFQEIFGSYFNIVHNIVELKSLIRKNDSKLPWE